MLVDWAASCELDLASHAGALTDAHADAILERGRITGDPFCRQLRGMLG